MNPDELLAQLFSQARAQFGSLVKEGMADCPEHSGADCDGADNLHTRSAESVSAPLPFSSPVATAAVVMNSCPEDAAHREASPASSHAPLTPAKGAVLYETLPGRSWLEW
jgi:hypothetical protein